MTIPSVDEMKEHAKQAQAAQDLALMLEQVMLRCPEKGEEFCLARAKLILAAKERVLAAPTGLGCHGQVTPTQPSANVFEAVLRATAAKQLAIEEQPCK